MQVHAQHVGNEVSRVREARFALRLLGARAVVTRVRPLWTVAEVGTLGKSLLRPKVVQIFENEACPCGPVLESSTNRILYVSFARSERIFRIITKNGQNA